MENFSGFRVLESRVPGLQQKIAPQVTLCANLNILLERRDFLNAIDFNGLIQG
jgi:hypothetical protein